MSGVPAHNDRPNLAHYSSNTSESINFICYCCTCHCGIMESIKVADSPNAAAESSFLIHLDEDECIGCGLCVSTCSTKALKLVPRVDAPRSSSDVVGA